MKREKRPTLLKKDAAYPSLRQSKVDRRRFLTLLGGGVAGSTLFAACYESGSGGIGSLTGTGSDSGSDPSSDTGTESVTDTGMGSDSETVDTGWDTNEPLGGEPPEPDFFQRRLPGADFQVAYLAEGSEVVYAVATVFEERLFWEMSDEDLLAIIDEKLQTSHPAIIDYETEDGLDRVEATVKEALTKSCLAEKDVDPNFVEVTFVVERVRRNEPLDGAGGAEPNLQDTDSGLGW